MGKTPIQWCDHSINPFRARNIETGKTGHFCLKISPGCRGCYSSAMQTPFLTQLEFVATNRPKVELYLEEKALAEVLRRKKPTRYFWVDMSDMFLEDYPDEWIDRVFAIMALTQQHTHLVLTKRANRMLSYFMAGMSHMDSRRRVQDVLDSMGHRQTADALIDRWPLPNVHLGVSVEDRQRQQERVPLLQRTPAAHRFISQEPQLESIPWDAKSLAGISQVIVGGESGHHARLFDFQWARDTRDACHAHNVKFFFKQAGANPITGRDGLVGDFHFTGNPRFDSIGNDLYRVRLNDRKHGGDMAEWPSLLQAREMA